jgi:hypothetical protein
VSKSFVGLCAAETSSSEEEEDEGGGYERALPQPSGFAAIPFNYGPPGREQGGNEADAAAEAATKQQQRRQHGSNSSTGYHAVGLTYDAQPAPAAPGLQVQQAGPRPASQQEAQLPLPGPDEPAFVADFVVPEYLRRHLPATERHFKVGSVRWA